MAEQEGNFAATDSIAVPPARIAQESALQPTLDDNDDAVCDACLVGEVYENNEIIFCDKCNVAVHQLCYSITDVPEGSWFCYPCSEGADPQTIKCEVCFESNGAFKHVDKPGKWAHALCTAWIPELYEVHSPGQLPFTNLSRIDQKRYKLKCGLCNKRGACVQCSYGRCTTAVHPACALRNPRGFTHRIVKDSEGVAHWEIFCKAHAFALSEPVKIKHKGKHNQKLDGQVGFAEEDGNYWNDTDQESLNRSASQQNMRPVNGGKGKGRPQGSEVVEASKQKRMGSSAKQAEKITFPLLSLLEWPGMSEGEGMDLDHYWNYVSSYFVEDHPREWFDFMTEGLGDMMNLSLPVIPKSLQGREIEEAIEEIESFLGTERMRQAAYDLSKWQMLNDQVNKLVQKLKETVQLDQASLARNPLTTLSNGLDSLSIDGSESDGNGKKNGTKLHGSESVKIRATVEGKTRVHCGFKINSINTSGGSSLIDLTQLAGSNSSGFICSSSQASASIQDDTIKSAVVDLETFEIESQRLALSTHEHGSLDSMINLDQTLRNALNKLLEVRLRHLLTRPELSSRIGKHLRLKEEWQQVQTTYVKQQVWKKIALCLCKGIRDQPMDFNKFEAEAIPASWKVKVNGRVKPDEDEEEEHEDAVCMCCFDGSSSEGNRILFCDGCNAAVHQQCYGVPEIPEGDYYCDRCRFVQSMDYSGIDLEVDKSSVLDAARCCLCPLYHGGMKQVNDGRWVHICCFLWAKNSEIVDLKEMNPLNISQVSVLPWRSVLRESETKSEESAYCIYCGYRGGYLESCSHIPATLPSNLTQDSRKSGVKHCKVHFHPLCAWFEGKYVKADLTDPTFLAETRNGVYPSGVSFCFLCDEHAGSVRTNWRIGSDQKTLRRKYKISTEDMGQIPGKHRKKRKYKRRLTNNHQSAAGEVRMAAPVVAQPKDLPPDHYDSTICAICLQPTSGDLFGCGFDPTRFEMKGLETLSALDPGGNASKTSEVRATAKETCDSGNGSLSVTNYVSLQPSSSSSASNNSATRSALVDVSSAPPFVTCAKCNLAVHLDCVRSIDPLNEPQWKCLVCKWKENIDSLSCSLCPRRGGFLVRANDKWAHLYCALNIPGQAKITMGYGVDIRQISKDSKKQKCIICNRKSGVCLQCSSIGCSCFFHPLCAVRSGKVLIRCRQGTREAFCPDHTPESVEHLSSGFWVDGYEMHRFRHCLERGRLIMDMLQKREKFKKAVCKIEAEAFAANFTALLNRAKGIKSGNAEQEMSIASDASSDGELSSQGMEEDDLDLDDEEVAAEDVAVGSRIKKKREKVEAVRLPDVDVDLPDGSVVKVNARYFNKKGEVKPPRHVKLSFAGLGSVTRNEVSGYSDREHFLKKYTNDVNKTKESWRPLTYLFQDNTAEEVFMRNTRQELYRVLKAAKKAAKNLGKAENNQDEQTVTVPTTNRGRKRKVVKLSVENNGEEKEIGTLGNEECLVIKVDQPLSKKRKGSTDLLLGEESATLRTAQCDDLNGLSEEAVMQEADRLKEIAESSDFQDLMKHFAIPMAKEVAKSFVKQGRRSTTRKKEATENLPLSSFDDSFRFATDGNQLMDETDWQVCSGQRKVELERRMMDILNRLETAKRSYRRESGRATESSVNETLNTRSKRAGVPSAADDLVLTIKQKPVARQSPQKRATSPQQSDDSDLLVNDFRTIPFDTIPDYRSYVRRLICLDDIRQTLIRHHYNTMSAFAHDFYTLMNNARSVTAANSETWKAARQLSKAFEEFKSRVDESPHCLQPRSATKQLVISRFAWPPLLHGPRASEESKVGATDGSTEIPPAMSSIVEAYANQSTEEQEWIQHLSGHLVQCMECNQLYTIENWPPGFPLPHSCFQSLSRPTANDARPAKGRRSKGAPPNHGHHAPPAHAAAGVHQATQRCEWLCRDCVQRLSRSEKLIGETVRVWWEDDHCDYTGRIVAVDEVSSTICVLYQDEEWEFIDLAGEPYLLVAVQNT